MYNSKNKITGSLIFAIGIALQSIATEGINLIGIGPVQQGTAGAGVASAKDSTWLILNPAGLVDIERGVDSSFQVFAPNRTIDSTVSGGAGEQKDNSFFVIPSISASFGCCGGKNGFVGFGLYGTSGMGVDYNQGRIGGGGFPPTTPQSVGDKMTELSIAKLTATYAYKAGDSGFSIGAGPILLLSRFRTDIQIFGTPTYSSADWDTATGVGGIVGINQRLGLFSIGASYITEQWMESFNEYDDLLAGSLNLPQQITAGVAFSALPNLELVADYRWIGWNQLNTLGDQFGWEDQNIVKVGATWGVTDALTIRGGISHGNSPIDSDTAFGNALFPAIMKTHATVGISYAREKWIFHASYMHAFKESVTANGNDAPGNFGAGTEISMYQNSLTAGATLHF